jgi:hypothetical protein
MPPPFQLGTVTSGVAAGIDVAVWLLPYPLTDVKCSEVIDYCLRPSPDAKLWFDYTTSPPTAKVTSRANRTAVTKALADGVSHESLRIVKREDLLARSVLIYFKMVDSVDGVSWVQKVEQKYGPHGANSALDPDGGLRVVINTCDIQGYNVTNMHGHLDVLAVANTLAFWMKVLPEFVSTRVRNFVASNLAAVDESGTPVSLTDYPNVLMDGSSICAWMLNGDSSPVLGQRVTITADVTYKLYDVEATRTGARVTCGDMGRPPKDRMLRIERHVTKSVFREMAGKPSAEVLQRLHD